MIRDIGALTRPPARRVGALTEQLVEPLSRLRGEVDRLFDDFPMRFPAAFSFGRLGATLPVPAVEMTETEKSYKISVEVPGMEASDIEVGVEDDMLVISGEKKEEREENEEGYSLSERSYGAFERRIELPPTAKADDIKAKVRKGVLQITLPKNAKAGKSRRKVAVEAD
jgi:HSP20 family protein